MNRDDRELEVKFCITRAGEMEAKIIALGGKLSEPRVHEVNLRFDTPDRSLLETGRLLRLRMDRRARLTYKGVGDEQGGARLREELEFTVSDFETARKLFEALGYQVMMMYEKYRTTYTLGELEIVLDELPYGNFIEIEGPDGGSIQKAAEGLGLSWERRILLSYTVLFENASEALALNFSDLSFDNFMGLEFNPDALGVQVAD